LHQYNDSLHRVNVTLCRFNEALHRYNGSLHCVNESLYLYNEALQRFRASALPALPTHLAGQERFEGAGPRLSPPVSWVISWLAWQRYPSRIEKREKIARRGDEIYERDVCPHLGPDDEGKFVLIDVESGDHEMDRDEISASDRLLARHPEARVWMRQVGSRYARRFGPRFKEPWLEGGA